MTITPQNRALAEKIADRLPQFCAEISEYRDLRINGEWREISLADFIAEILQEEEK